MIAPVVCLQDYLSGYGFRQLKKFTALPHIEFSHFDAQNILETGGNAAYALKDGWLNRLLPLLPAAPPPVAIAATLPALLRGAAPTTSFAPSRLPDASASLKARVAALYENDALLHRLWNEAMATEVMAGSSDGGAGNPQGLAASAARLLADPAGPRIAVLDLGGWDTHAGQALHQKLLLHQAPGLGQGHQGLGALHCGSAGPQIGAGMQRRQSGIEPGVLHQGGESIDALQQQRPISRPCQRYGVLRRRHLPGGLEPGQSRLQWSRRQLGGAAAAGHGGMRRFGERGSPTGRSLAQALAEAPVDPILESPDPAVGAQRQRPPKGHRRGTEAPAIGQ
jgi:hypothetical protein